MSQDRETLELIGAALTAFEQHSLRLSDLIEQVPSMVKTLSAETPWKDEFIGYWWTLEQVHEEAIELGESGKLPPSRRDAVDDAVKRMHQLINGALV